MGNLIIGIENIAKKSNRSIDTIERWIDLQEKEKSPIKQNEQDLYYVDEDELNAWLKRVKTYKIEGLKRIALYFNKESERTIKRWYKEKNLPLHIVRNRYFGYIDEMDLWHECVEEKREEACAQLKKEIDNDNKGIIQNEKIKTIPERPQQEKEELTQGDVRSSLVINDNDGIGNLPERNKKHSFFSLNFKSILVISILFLSLLFIIFSVRVLAMKDSGKGGEVIVKTSVDGSLVKLQAFVEGNERDSLSFYYRFANEVSARNRINYPAEKPQFYATGDINGDSLTDLIVINPGERNGILVYTQKDNKLVFKDKKSFVFSHNFGKSSFQLDYINYLQCGDLNRDGIDEIIVLMSNSDVFPACVLILDNKLNKKGIIYHPGWFRSAVVKDLNHDGKNELYVSGTNNNLVHFSEEIVVGIDGDFDKKFEFDLFPYNKGLKENIKNFKIAYARLNYSRWLDTTYQIAYINNLNNYPDKLIVAGAIAQYKDNNGAHVQSWIKTFSFGYLLKLKKAWIFDSPLKYKNISLTQDEIKKALTPHYWNGKTWQDNWCVIQ